MNYATSLAWTNHALVQYYVGCSAVVQEAFSPQHSAQLAIPVHNCLDAMKLRTDVAERLLGNTSLAFCFSDHLLNNKFRPIVVPCWVQRLVEIVWDRLRSCPGRAVICDSPLWVTLFKTNGKASSMPRAVMWEVCRIINAGVQDFINTVHSTFL